MHCEYGMLFDEEKMQFKCPECLNVRPVYTDEFALLKQGKLDTVICGAELGEKNCDCQYC